MANIHLCALFHVQDLKRYSFSEILAPIVRDIKVLESDGIEIPLYSGRVRGSVVQVTGDNLGLHGLFGLVESFNARYCCRLWLAEKDDFQTEFSEDFSKIVYQRKLYCSLSRNDQESISSLYFWCEKTMFIELLKVFSHNGELFS